MNTGSWSSRSCSSERPWVFTPLPRSIEWNHPNESTSACNSWGVGMTSEDTDGAAVAHFYAAFGTGENRARAAVVFARGGRASPQEAGPVTGVLWAGAP